MPVVGSPVTSASVTDSSGNAYALIGDMENRYDSRVLAQLSNDENGTTRVDEVLQASLEDAYARINSAALQGSQYTVAQLEELVDAGDTMLVRMNCDLAIKFMAQRRGMGLPKGLESQVKESLDLLEALQQGKRVLNIDANRGADVPEIVTLTSDQQENLGSLTNISFFGGPQATKTTAG